MIKTLNDNETEPTGRRTLPWKGRSTRAQQQHQHQQQQQNQLLQLPDSSSDVSYFNGYSDTISIPSRTSSEHQGNISGNDMNQMTRSEQVDLQDFHGYFTQVSLDDPTLQGFQCSLRNDNLIHGQLFITKLYLFFKSNSTDPTMTTVEFKVASIKSIDLVRPGRWKPRMIQVTLKNDAKYTFTAFLPSTIARDEAYQCLMEIWQPRRPSVIDGASTSPTPALSYNLRPVIMKSNSTLEGDGSDSTTITNENNKSNESLMTTLPATPIPTGPFKLFQRKRAQTMTTEHQQEHQKNRSVNSSSTPLAKSLNTQVIWNADQSPLYIQPKESDPPTKSRVTPLYIQQSQNPENRKKELPSSPTRLQSLSSPISPPVVPPQRQHLFTRINTKTMLMMAGFLLLLSYAFLAYQFYHMTHLLTTHQLQQQQRQKAISSIRQRQDNLWLYDQLEKATKEAHRWEKETLQQNG